MADTMAIRSKAKLLIVIVIVCVVFVHMYLLRESPKDSNTKNLESQPFASTSSPTQAAVYQRLTAAVKKLTSTQHVDDNTDKTKSSHSSAKNLMKLKNKAVSKRQHKTKPAWLYRENLPSVNSKHSEVEADVLLSTDTLTGDQDVSKSKQTPEVMDSLSMSSVSWLKNLEEMDKYKQSDSYMESTDYSFLINLNAIGIDSSDDFIEDDINTSVDYSFMDRLNSIDDKPIPTHESGIVSSNFSTIQDIAQDVRTNDKEDKNSKIITQHANQIEKLIAKLDVDLNFTKYLKHRAKQKDKPRPINVTFIPPISLIEVKRRYSMTKRTDISEELYRLAPDVSIDK